MEKTIRSASVSSQEFLCLTDEAVVFIMNNFKTSSSISELLVKKRDVTAYKFQSLKK